MSTMIRQADAAAGAGGGAFGCRHGGVSAWSARQSLQEQWRVRNQEAPRPCSALRAVAAGR
jgi:hypothetical protein